MTYEFDKAVPIPTSVERLGVNIEMLRAMQPGESKWWDETEAKKAARFYRVAKKQGIPIVIRKVGKTDPRGPGVRMWRGEGGPPAVVNSVDPIAAAAEAAERTAKPKRKGGVAKKVAKPAKAPKKAAPKTAPKPKGKRKLVAGVPSTPAALKRAAQ